VLAGEVALEDPLSRHLPPDLPLPRRPGRELTLVDLATHSSGLPQAPRGFVSRELLFGLGAPGAEDPWRDLPRQEFAAALARTRVRSPGKRVRYSSLGFGLLGHALAARTGRPYEELVLERFSRPLGLADTAVEVPAAKVDRLAAGFSVRGRPRPALHDAMLAPAGELRSTAADMLRFLGACLEPGSSPPGPALALAAEPRVRVSRRLSLGLGWLVMPRSRGAPTVRWHNGGTWGFRSFAAFSPEEGTAAVVLGNSGRSVDRMGFRLLDSLARHGH
jgi:CubicO group peptidase (beta-lactamase class C family)